MKKELPHPFLRAIKVILLTKQGSLVKKDLLKKTCFQFLFIAVISIGLMLISSYSLILIIPLVVLFCFFKAVVFTGLKKQESEMTNYLSDVYDKNQRLKSDEIEILKKEFFNLDPEIIQYLDPLVPIKTILNNVENHIIKKGKCTD